MVVLNGVNDALFYAEAGEHGPAGMHYVDYEPDDLSNIEDLFTLVEIAIHFLDRPIGVKKALEVTYDPAFGYPTFTRFLWRESEIIFFATEYSAIVDEN